MRLLSLVIMTFSLSTGNDRKPFCRQHIPFFSHFRFLFYLVEKMIVNRRLINAIQSFLPVQIFLCYCFCVSGLLINILQLLSWIFVWPFNKKVYRQINYHLATLLWSRT